MEASAILKYLTLGENVCVEFKRGGNGFEDDSYDASIGTATNSSHHALNHNEQTITALMKANPRITIAELSSTTGLSTSGVKYIINELKRKSIISRSGAAKGGTWVVNM